MAPVHLRLRALGALTALAAALGPAVSGCSLVGADDQPESSSDVVLVTHDSFVLPKPLIAQFERQSGYHLVVHAAGDGGTLTNKLVLTQGNPTGDVAFGVDNTFASRALDADVFARSDVRLPAGAQQYVVPGDDGRLAPIDNGNVCVNIDTGWFTDHDVAPPRSLDDLVKPAYDGLTAVPGATTSSTGLAFLLGTIGKYGDGWSSWWQKLVDNGATITDGWTQAYETDFTQGGGHGHDPIVVSYDSSPAFTVPKGGDTSTTEALLDTCFRQVEYAGVLRGTDAPDAAHRLVDFLLTPAFQSEIALNLFVYPANDTVSLPAAFTDFAVVPDHPATLDPATIAAHRQSWIETWTDVVLR